MGPYVTKVVEWLFPVPPVLKEMPKHVSDLKIDHAALALHMAAARYPNPKVQTGVLAAPK